MLMEYMPEDLADHIEHIKYGPPFEMHVAIDIALQIAKVMRYLHRMKITHRDLKPSNVLVRPGSGGSAYLQVKLADLGLSKYYNGTRTWAKQTKKMGTSVYAAPEVFIAAEDIGAVAPNFPPKADVWSFAMTFSEILTGQSPFQGEEKSGLHKRIIRGLRPVLPGNLPADLHSCITSCWSASPGKRPNFQTICSMLHLAKALSLGIFHPTLPRSFESRLDASSTVNVSEMESITGYEVGQKYILVGTNFKFYEDKSKVKEISTQFWKIPSTGIEDQDTGHPQASWMSFKPIHRVIMQGRFWADSLSDFAYGCLTGVFVNSEYETELRTMNVKVVEGGFLGETNTRSTEPVVEKYFWGAQISAPGKDVARFYCQGEYLRRYVYVYLRYGLSKAAVISHLWLDNDLVLGDKSTADSASKDAIVMGSKVLVSHERSLHVTTTLSLSSEAS